MHLDESQVYVDDIARRRGYVLPYHRKMAAADHDVLRAALDNGATERDVLEAIEIALPEVGVVAFQHGFEVWCEVTGQVGIDPSPGVMGGEPHPGVGG